VEPGVPRRYGPTATGYRPAVRQIRRVMTA
jgi:hypothetical protein